ncbi:hypothetical protein V6N13_001201 [Hibiscus sabdariffa]
MPSVQEPSLASTSPLICDNNSMLINSVICSTCIVHTMTERMLFNELTQNLLVLRFDNRLFCPFGVVTALIMYRNLKVEALMLVQL